MLVSLEGADGVGKSTLAPMVAELLSDHYPAIFSSSKDVPGDPPLASEHMVRLRGMLWPGGDIEGGRDLPKHHWLCLQAAWYSMSSKFVIGPLLAEGNLVVVDGWYHKSLARAYLKGWDMEFLDHIFGGALKPDVVVHLDADLAKIFQRKKFSLHELGGYHTYPSLGLASYLDYQSKMANALCGSVAADALFRVSIAPGQTAAANAAAIAEALQKFLHKRSEASPW
jgi:dTMP kinase